MDIKMEETENAAATDFVSSLCFVKRGVAKEKPIKVVLTPAELAKIISETKEELGEANDNSSDCEIETAESTGAINGDDEFRFEGYDQESANQVASIRDIALVDENEDIKDEVDSEEDDEKIVPTDNLILVGHVQDESASLEVWVFNAEEESFYTLHDFLLPSLPLCIEWLNHDPESEKNGNLCAIGCVDPVITVWDLDIQDSIEPVIKLGSKGSTKRKIKKFGHTDAVLDLSWNTNYTHILASSSVDKSVILWDLDKGIDHTTISCFKDKVDSIAFQSDGDNLLTGSSDKYVRLFDGKFLNDSHQNFLKWKTNEEIVKVLWNPNDSNYFMAGTNVGKLFYADVRQPKQFLWTVEAHDDEISGIYFNKETTNMLITSATDGLVKIWKLEESQCKEVYRHDFQLGKILCSHQSPDDPYTFTFGGEINPKFKVYNVKNFEAVRVCFNLDDNYMRMDDN